MHGKAIIKPGLVLGCRPQSDVPEFREPDYHPEFLGPETAHGIAERYRGYGHNVHALLIAVELPPADDLLAFANQLTERRRGKHRMIRLVAHVEIDRAANELPQQKRRAN